MSQRKSVNGRPSGTDGFDFSYRMVVDSRYQKVAEGKSRLCKLIFIQGFIHLLASIVVFLPTAAEGGSFNRVSFSSCVISFISLLIGELGRKRSRAILLKLYLFGSSVAIIISVVSMLQGEKTLELLIQVSMFGWIQGPEAESSINCSAEISLAYYGESIRKFVKNVTDDICEQVMKDPSRWATSKLEVSEIGVVSLGVVVQIFAFAVATSLIHNMAPPKRAAS